MTLYQAHAVVDIGYLRGEGERVHVVNQLIFVRTFALNLEFYKSDSVMMEEAVHKHIREKVMARLVSNMNNYGVEGLKRWDPRVLSLKLEPRPGEEEE